MNASSAVAPATDYERFLSALPDSLHQECATKLSGTGLAANHPVFVALAELYEQQNRKPTRDFVNEAITHSDLAKQLLNDFKDIPAAILARIEPQLTGLLGALNGPVEKLDVAVTSLQRNVEALPVLLLGERPPKNEDTAQPDPDGIGPFIRKARSPFIYHPVATSVLSFALGLAVSATVLALASVHLSRSYEQAYQTRVAHMEADSVTNTVTLNRLLALGLTLKVERGSDADDWFLILGGARKAAKPVDSPEGPAVEVWR